MSKIRHIRKKGRSISMIITDDYGEDLGLNILGNTTTRYPINADLAEAIIGSLTEYIKTKIGNSNECNSLRQWDEL